MFIIKIKSFIKRIYFKNRYKNLILGNHFYISGVNISNNGLNNSVYIERGASVENCSFLFYGNNNHVKIGKGTTVKGVVFWLENDANEIKINEKCTFEGNTQIAACEGTKVEIGEDCMFSHSILVRTTDSHSIVDKEGVRINQASDIYIGNHVWIGLQSLILKGVNIPDNCVVGARSLVASSKELEPNSVIVGSPAKCVRKNINWLRDRI